MRRCVRTLFADVLDAPRPLHSPRHRLLPKQYSQPAAWTRRSYATEAIPFEDASTGAPGLPAGPPTPYIGQSSRPTNKELPPKEKKNLELELQWLRDPLKLGDRVIGLLKEDNFQKALNIVRLASREMECTVSWNYLVDYEMSKGRVQNATKLYNEVRLMLSRRIQVMGQC